MPIQLRALSPADREPLAQMLARIPQFDLEDVALALELIDFALERPGQKDYAFKLAFETGKTLVGYACYGPTPITDRTFSLYWIAVIPECAGQGIGTQILEAVEQELQELHARMLLIETSSRPDYELTRRFYLKNGCQVAEVFRDFFRVGEDRVTYIKRFETPASS